MHSRVFLWSDRVHRNHGQHLDRLSLCTQARIFFERSNVRTQACVLVLQLFIFFPQRCHADHSYAGFYRRPEAELPRPGAEPARRDASFGTGGGGAQRTWSEADRARYRT